VKHPKNPVKRPVERKNNLVWLEKLRHDMFDNDDVKIWLVWCK